LTVIDRWLARHSITALRVRMGVVIFIFGLVKYFPGVSPAQGLVLAVSRILTFGLLPDRVSLVLFATVESIGDSVAVGPVDWAVVQRSAPRADVAGPVRVQGPW
jgi:hypothetical protein